MKNSKGIKFEVLDIKKHCLSSRIDWWLYGHLITLNISLMGLFWPFKTKEKSQKPFALVTVFLLVTLSRRKHIACEILQTHVLRSHQQQSNKQLPVLHQQRLGLASLMITTRVVPGFSSHRDFPWISPRPHFWGSTSTVILSRLTFGRRVYVCACATQVIHHRKWFQSALIIKQGTHFSGTTQRIASSKGKQERERKRKERGNLAYENSSALWWLSDCPRHSLNHHNSLCVRVRVWVGWC